jgi:hypothetical protein
LPWIQCRFRRKNGGWEYHWLAINDDSWVRVKTRPCNEFDKLESHQSLC